MVPCGENSKRIPAGKLQENFDLARYPYLIWVTKDWPRIDEWPKIFVNLLGETKVK